MKYLAIIVFLLTACGHKTDIRAPKENRANTASISIESQLQNQTL